MEAVGGLVVFPILAWLAYSWVLSPIIYLLSPVVEREAVVVGMSEETKVGSFSVSVYSTTNYLVSLPFEDGRSGDSACSRSVYGRLDRGERIWARTKRHKLLSTR